MGCYLKASQGWFFWVLAAPLAARGSQYYACPQTRGDPDRITPNEQYETRAFLDSDNQCVCQTRSVGVGVARAWSVYPKTNYKPPSDTSLWTTTLQGDNPPTASFLGIPPIAAEPNNFRSFGLEEYWKTLTGINFTDPTKQGRLHYLGSHPRFFGLCVATNEACGQVSDPIPSEETKPAWPLPKISDIFFESEALSSPPADSLYWSPACFAEISHWCLGVQEAAPFQVQNQMRSESNYLMPASEHAKALQDVDWTEYAWGYTPAGMGIVISAAALKAIQPDMELYAENNNWYRTRPGSHGALTYYLTNEASPLLCKLFISIEPCKTDPPGFESSNQNITIEAVAQLAFPYKFMYEHWGTRGADVAYTRWNSYTLKELSTRSSDLLLEVARDPAALQVKPSSPIPPAFEVNRPVSPITTTVCYTDPSTYIDDDKTCLMEWAGLPNTAAYPYNNDLVLNGTTPIRREMGGMLGSLTCRADPFPVHNNSWHEKPAGYGASLLTKSENNTCQEFCAKSNNPFHELWYGPPLLGQTNPCIIAFCEEGLKGAEKCPVWLHGTYLNGSLRVRCVRYGNFGLKKGYGIDTSILGGYSCEKLSDNDNLNQHACCSGNALSAAKTYTADPSPYEHLNITETPAQTTCDTGEDNGLVAGAIDSILTFLHENAEVPFTGSKLKFEARYYSCYDPTRDGTEPPQGFPDTNVCNDVENDTRIIPMPYDFFSSTTTITTITSTTTTKTISTTPTSTVTTTATSTVTSTATSTVTTPGWIDIKDPEDFYNAMWPLYVPVAAANDFTVFFPNFDAIELPRDQTAVKSAERTVYLDQHRAIPPSYFDSQQLFCYPSVSSIATTPPNYEHTYRGSQKELDALEASATTQPTVVVNSMSCLVHPPNGTVPSYIASLKPTENSPKKSPMLVRIPDTLRPHDIVALFANPYADAAEPQRFVSETGRCVTTTEWGGPQGVINDPGGNEIVTRQTGTIALNNTMENVYSLCKKLHQNTTTLDKSVASCKQDPACAYSLPPNPLGGTAAIPLYAHAGRPTGTAKATAPAARAVAVVQMWQEAYTQLFFRTTHDTSNNEDKLIANASADHRQEAAAYLDEYLDLLSRNLATTTVPDVRIVELVFPRAAKNKRKTSPAGAKDTERQSIRTLVAVLIAVAVVVGALGIACCFCGCYNNYQKVGRAQMKPLI